MILYQSSVSNLCDHDRCDYQPLNVQKTSDRAEDDSIVAHNFRKVNSLSIKRAKMRKESWQNSGKYDENRKRY